MMPIHNAVFIRNIVHIIIPTFTLYLFAIYYFDRKISSVNKK